ncbi:hypothetical protein [Leisingera methylohalidivorans]|uniref:hypothetical protein n=1 Tax=Leisingera methylohalidivorans TaxID=133924 RepID=UPI001FE05E5C|nr:hypothetical protein [Leisingera methylohalidivorans]
MHSNINHLSLILEPSQSGQQNQMAGGGNWQEFGNTLDKRNQDQLEKRHPEIIPHWPRAGRKLS